MSNIEKMLQCSDCKDKLDELCKALDYNDAEREIAAEVLLWLDMGKLKKEKLVKPFTPTIPITPSCPSIDELYAIKC